MASTVTLSSLRDQARQRADMVNSGFISDSELNGFINESLLELYDLLVEKFESEYYHTTSNISIGPTTNSYALPSNFYKMKGVEISQDGGNTRFVTLVPYMFNERNRYAYSGNALPTRTVRIRYVPVFTRLEDLKTFTTGNVDITLDRVTITSHGFTANTAVTLTTTGTLPGGLSISTTYYILVVDANTIQFSLTSGGSAIDLTSTGSGTHTIDDNRNDFDGINGYEAYAVWRAVENMLSKEESDTSFASGQVQRQYQRIESAALNRDSGMPQRIIDVNTINDIQLRIYQETNIRYRIIGNNIEFIYIGYLGV